MPNQDLLVRTPVELTDSLVDDFDTVDSLTLFTDRCVCTLDVTSARVMLATSGGEVQMVDSSSDGMSTLELFQLQTNKGPCVDRYAPGAGIVNLDLSRAKGIPSFVCCADPNPKSQRSLTCQTTRIVPVTAATRPDRSAERPTEGDPKDAAGA